MNPNSLELLAPREVDSLDPIRVQEYVRATGWHLEPRLGKGKVAVYERPGSRLDQLSIPLNHEVADFSEIMAVAVSALARFEKRSAAGVLTDLLFPPSDVLKFAETSQSSASGSVPFEYGVNLIEGAKKTLLAAACTALKPAKFHPRLSRADAQAFIEKCRLGQTERGSFVLTVACPLDIAISSPIYREHFTRFVSESLMYSLRFIAHHLERGDTDSLLATPEDITTPLLSANLCEGLLDMAPREEDGALNIVAHYSPELANTTATSVAPRVVRLTANMFPKIERLAIDLKPADQPKTGQFFGFVETLDGRPNEEKMVEGKVILRLITPEETIHARAELGAQDHNTAINAYRTTQPISLKGTLRQVGRKSYRIDDISSFTNAQPQT